MPGQIWGSERGRGQKDEIPERQFSHFHFGAHARLGEGGLIEREGSNSATEKMAEWSGFEGRVKLLRAHVSVCLPRSAPPPSPLPLRKKTPRSVLVAGGRAARCPICDVQVLFSVGRAWREVKHRAQSRARSVQGGPAPVLYIQSGF